MPNLKNLINNPRNILLAGAVVILIFLITPFLIAGTSNPKFCNSFCHEMDPAVNSWKDSTHANITCYSCHGAKNLPLLIYHKMIALNELKLHVTNDYEQPINIKSELSENKEEMGTNICNRCHNVTNREVTPSKGIIINHKAHDKKGINCTKCHNRVAHLSSEKYLDSKIKEENPKKYENRLKMKFCMKCHNNKQAPRACKTCHPKDFELKPLNHKQSNFFPEKHGKIAKKDIEYCQSCHFESKKCLNCHKTEIPHPSTGWKDKIKGYKHHSVAGKKDSKNCQLCHKQGPDFCNDCHHNNKSNKPWIKVHFDTVKKQGGAKPCFTCHNEGLDCAHCHVNTNN